MRNPVPYFSVIASEARQSLPLFVISSLIEPTDVFSGSLPTGRQVKRRIYLFSLISTAGRNLGSLHMPEDFSVVPPSKLQR